MTLALEYYLEKQNCKSKKGYDCSYPGWCALCGNLEYNEEHIQYIDDFSNANFKYDNQVTLQLIGPKESPYEGRFISVLINIPYDYPN